MSNNNTRSTRCCDDAAALFLTADQVELIIAETEEQQLQNKSEAPLRGENDHKNSKSQKFI